MRNTARILGIAGGIVGIISALVVLLVGGAGEAIGLPGAGFVTGLGWLSLVGSVVGIVGGAIAMTRPIVAAVLMLIGAILGFIGISWIFVLAGLLLIAGAVVAYMGRDR